MPKKASIYLVLIVMVGFSAALFLKFRTPSLTAFVSPPDPAGQMSVTPAPTTSVPDSSASSSGNGPKIPATATVIANIDQFSSGWSNCSSAGCAGGQGFLTYCTTCRTAYYYMKQGQTSPAENGLSTKFAIGSGAVYSNALFADKITSNSTATNLVHDYYFYGDINSLHAQAMEFDLIQVSGGRKYNWGSQCAYVSGVWDLWNEATQHWVPTNIPCVKFSANTWHHVQWQVQRFGTNARYISLTIDGVTTPISPAIANQPSVPTNWAPGVSVQFQEDESASGIGYNVWMDNWKVAMW